MNGKIKQKSKNGATREDIYEYAEKKYGTIAEYPWGMLPLYSVLRRADNKKWYAIIMNVPRNKLGLYGDERIDILDIKCSPVIREMLLNEKGFLPAYHLNRENWLTVLLDGSVDIDTVFNLLDESYDIAKSKSKKAIRYEPTSWLVSVNPKYYDIEKAFEENDIILWKQSNSVIVGDTIYLYIAVPYSCVLYKCKAVEVNIPYEYDDGKVRMQKVMKIQRLYKYDKSLFGLDELKEHGIISVRGPRSIPYGLRYKLEKESENGTQV